MRVMARQSMGLPADPWRSVDLRTSDCIRVRQAVRAAVEAQLMVWIVGARGSGKSHAVRGALPPGCRVIEPLRLERERLRIGDVERAIVRECSDEPVRQSAEARSHQVRRILGAGARGRRHVLLIDDAHVLHAATLKALKRLRELAWRHVPAPLLGVILVGQADRGASLPEVGLRSDTMSMEGLDEAEAADGLRAALGESIEDDAVSLLAAQARWWLDMMRLADDAIVAAAARGSSRVTAAAVRSVIEPRAAHAEQPAAEIGAALDEWAATA